MYGAGSMAKSISYSLFVILLLLKHSLVGQELNREVEASIDIQQDGERYKIFFSAYNKTQTDKSLLYLLKVIENEPGDSTVIKHTYEDSEYFVLRAGEKSNLKKPTTVIPDINQRIIAFVLIYQEDKVISKDRIVLYGLKENDGRVSFEDPIESASPSEMARPEVNLLQGLVVGETKTKPGHDFYSYLFIEYNNNNINGNKLVRVSEELAIRGNTVIKVYAGDDLVVQFLINPRADYLKNMAIQTVSRLDYYFRQNAAVNNNSIKY